MAAQASRVVRVRGFHFVVTLAGNVPDSLDRVQRSFVAGLGRRFVAADIPMRVPAQKTDPKRWRPIEMIPSRRSSALSIGIAVSLLAGACTAGVGTSNPTSTSPSVPTVTPTAPPTATARATAQAIPSGTVNLSAGTYAFSFPLLDAPGMPFPTVAITVPDGWNSYKDFAVQSLNGTPRQLVVSFWNVDKVYANGCHWLGLSLIDPGPTVDGLATVLAQRPLRNATAPVAVSLGGSTGEYLAWSVPADIDFSSCDRLPSDTQGFFESWTGLGPATDRYQQAPGQVDQLWILDVAGHRLVIDATYLPGSTGQDRTDLQQVVDSIRFVP
jgi:hypothetical protein